MLTLLWAGELVWREREAGLGEITDAAPVPEWVPFLGKFLGLGLRPRRVDGGADGDRDRHPGADGVRPVRDRPVPEGAVRASASRVPALRRARPGGAGAGRARSTWATSWRSSSTRSSSSPRGWGSSTTCSSTGPRRTGSTRTCAGSARRWGRGGGSCSTGPRGRCCWAVAARLLWVRGLERSPRVRLRLARGRLTRPTAAVAAAAAGLVLGLGGFIFYNTNVLNAYRSASDLMELRAEYERRYGRYANVPQPRLAGASLRVEIHPRRRAAEIRGTYHLVNDTAAPIDTIHLAPAPSVRTDGGHLRPAGPARERGGRPVAPRLRAGDAAAARRLAAAGLHGASRAARLPERRRSTPCSP